MTCPRCQGLVVCLYDEPYCLNCGYRVSVADVREIILDVHTRNGTTYTTRRFAKRRNDATV